MFGIAIFSAQSTRRQTGAMICKTEWLSQGTEGMKTKDDRRGATILVAEDDDDNRFVMRTLLELRGYSVVEASNGQEALEIAEREAPDLILMDLKMPVLNGLAATRLIRQRQRRRVPIVALSAYDPTQHRAVAIAAGCDDYALKPVDYERLELIIETLLGAAPAPPTAPPTTKKPTGDLAA
ncbi:MAG: response regulator [Acidobacteria bacterium]|nr:response regulator [Acidobacteriota bacterium]